MALPKLSLSKAFKHHPKTPDLSAPKQASQAWVDTFVPASAKRTGHRARPQATPLRQGEQCASKGFADTIVNSLIFGFFASCGAAAFNSVRNSCRR